MSLTKFLDIIDKSFIGRFVDKQKKIVEQTDPNRIYVENIRSFYHMPLRMAKFFCELAVREGVFRKKYGVTCPIDHRIVMSFNTKAEIPKEIHCDTCEARGDEFEFSPGEKDIKIYYQLIKDTDNG